MRVDELVSKGAVGEVRALRDVEDLLDAGLGELAAEDGPEFSQDTEEGGLAAAVWAGDEQVHAWGDLEAHGRDEGVSVGGEDGHVLEDDLVGDHDLALVSEGAVHVAILAARLLDGKCVRSTSFVTFQGGVLDHDTLILASLEVIEHFLHFVDECGVACQVLHVLVGDNDSADGFGQVDEEGRVTNVILGDLGRIIAYFLQVFGTARSKDGKPNDSVADHDSAILDEHGIVDAHEEPAIQHLLDVLVQLVELAVDVGFLPVAAVVKGDFLGVVEQVRVLRPVLAFQLLLDGSQLAEGRGNYLDDAGGDKVPAEGKAWAFPADEFCEFPAEQDYVKYWLGKV